MGLYLDGTFEVAKAVQVNAAANTGAAATERTDGALTAKKAPSKKKEEKYGGMDSMEPMDKRKMRAQLALAQDKAAREAERKAQEAAAAQKREEKLLYLAHEEQWTTDQQLNPFETPRDFM